MVKPTRWHRVVPKVLFAYGCLTTLVGLYLHVIGVDLIAAFPVRPTRGEALCFAILCMSPVANLAAASPFKPSYSPWNPVFQPISSTVQLGRIAVVLAFCDVVYWFFRYFHSSASDIHENLAQSLAAFVVLMGCLPAACWALRPENLFPPKFLQAMRWDPISAWIIRPLVERRRAKRHAIPLNEWLAGVIECCETAAKGGRLVNSETPSADEVECLEFQYQLLDELESRGGVVHHRPQLSNDGFREIRRFIRSVDARRHREPDQEKWQQVVRDARSVLALRDKLRAGR
jgi:hypothetical protein